MPETIVSSMYKTKQKAMANSKSSKIKGGIKHDTGKDRWDLLPWDIVQDVVKVLTFGSTKYAPGNWKHVEPYQDRYFAACMRHLTAWRNGERIDKETKLSHLAQAISNLIFLAWKDKHGQALHRH